MAERVAPPPRRSGNAAIDTVGRRFCNSAVPVGPPAFRAVRRRFVASRSPGPRAVRTVASHRHPGAAMFRPAPSRRALIVWWSAVVASSLAATLMLAAPAQSAVTREAYDAAFTEF